MKVFIDTRENNRIKPALFYFGQKNTVTITELETGDYIFVNEENNDCIVFEYKTIEDFIQSIKDNRVFNQSIDQYNEFKYHFVIIVGTDKQKTEYIKDTQRYTGDYVTNNQYYGAICSLSTYTNVIQVPRQSIAFEVMEKQAIKCFENKPLMKRYRKSEGNPAFRLLANNVNRIGLKTASKICDSLNLETVDDVFNLSLDSLMSVEGVGEKSAINILSQLKRKFEA